MRFTLGFLLLCFCLATTVVVTSQAAPLAQEALENTTFVVRKIRVGSETAGSHLLSLSVTNRSETERNFALDIRAEAVGLGLPNWQKQFFFPLPSHETRTIEAEYEQMSPLLTRTILRFGECPGYQSWISLPTKVREAEARPDVSWYWRREIWARAVTTASFRNSLAPYAAYLAPVSARRLEKIRYQLPDLIRKSRRTPDPLRMRLWQLFLAGRRYPGNYDFRTESWRNGFSALTSVFERQHVQALPFSISGDSGTRISAFVATRNGAESQRQPLIFLLTGNPPGIKESMAQAAIYFAKLGSELLQ